MQVSKINNQTFFTSRYSFRKMSKSFEINQTARHIKQLNNSSEVKLYENKILQRKTQKAYEDSLITEQMEQDMKDLMLHLEQPMLPSLFPDRDRERIILVGTNELSEIAELIRRHTMRFGIYLIHP